MSQYSLSTCDPLSAKQEDLQNVVRKVPKLGSQGSVLFEAGTISTRAGSLEDSLVLEIAEEDEKSDTPASSSSDHSLYPATPTDGRMHRRSRSILGGIIVESPAPSRRATVEEDELSALLSAESKAWNQCSSPSNTPTTPTSRTRPRPKRKAPPPLQPSTDPVADEDGSFETPVPTPTTPSAFSRAFGVFTRAFNR